VYFTKPLKGGPTRNLKEVLEGLQFRILPKDVHLKSSGILFLKVDDITDLRHLAVQN
jgi:hypothetical protein